ncbi:Dynein regulatory complex subunit 3 [Holothuria leucospilota]|uniref:Dynein regulatory complex subunit 3 n=1 Tax=Holothuria leucospilota TaxID=206669 RepID=A0A9Q1C370_HOLLE|nr:Dynein regulatory complex subunit 3 [Holothuria leucospilota]
MNMHFSTLTTLTVSQYSVVQYCCLSGSNFDVAYSKRFSRVGFLKTHHCTKMSRLYDTVAPSVIDEKLLLKAIDEQGPKEEAGRIAKEEETEFADIIALRLDFKNILKIDNLWEFTSLVKLQLDNNIIEKIEGLDSLVNLVWLDLSFNNIEVIENLDKLTKLEDLTLYNNRISVIENMDTLTRLHVLSIGNNNLSSLDNLIYLRKFKNLQTINLSGNPFCDEAKYKLFVVAHIPSLVYLDFRLIDENTKTAAKEQYRYAIEELVADETSAENKRLELEAAETEFNKQMAAYVENLDGPQLFESLFTDDPEAQKLASLPGVDELLNTYKEKMVAICQQVFSFGLQEHEKRQKEVSEFYACVEEAKKENKEMGVTKIADFDKYRKKCLADLTLISDSKVMDSKLGEYDEETSKLWDILMGYELQLVDQLEDTIKDFERSLADMVSNFVEHVQGLISQVRDLENIHHEKVLEIAISTLEKYVKNELDDELSEELKMLLVDKDTITSAVSASHDVHLLKIDNREDDIIQRANGWMASLMERIHQEEEVVRNRDRVKEINNFIDNLKEEVRNLELPGMQ